MVRTKNLLGFIDEPCASAVISECGRYRYSLTRDWSDEPRSVFVMLNPSTADALKDDPTIRRCTAFARDWGHGSIEVVNLFALRATDPVELLRATDPVGPDNDDYINAAFSRAAFVVCAWGAHSMAVRRVKTVREIAASRGTVLNALRVTKSGAPSHPLYLPRGLRAEPWRPPRRKGTFDE